LLEHVEQFDKILLSPGPGLPKEAGIMMKVIKKYAPYKSILGICLGHQGIAECFGARLKNLKDVLHGTSFQSTVIEKNENLFKGLPEKFEAGHYHSWIVDYDSIPEILNITAVDSNNYVMGLSHKEFDVKGLQFHPESIMTEYGLEIIQNWINN